MKYTLAVAAILVAASSNAWAEGQVSQAQLAELGLPGMTAMSDAQGSEIRGEGFAYASSVSTSSVFGSRNRSEATYLGFRRASAVSGSSTEAEISGDFLVFGAGRRGGFVLGGSFNLEVEVSSSGYAFASGR